VARLPRPCHTCGEPTGGTYCADCRPATPPTDPRRTLATFAYDRRWRKLSARVRKLQPFCLDCGSRDDLTADHIIPVVEAPELAHEPLNIAVRCRPCNSAKGDRCTDDQRAAVLDAIARRAARRRHPAGRQTRGRAPSQPAVSRPPRRASE
jgi:5-methylcytosine-specific restriction endonuclease McrA